jgi:hypothetical protein
MSGNYLVAKHQNMTICIVRPSRFITSTVEERRALVHEVDGAIAETRSRFIEAIALIGIIGTFVVLVAVLVFISLQV